MGINKTGQIESNVGKFLTLTHGLLGATVATTTNSNELDAEITTFGGLVGRECQDKVTVKQYFGDKNLSRFIPVLAKEDFTNLSELTCKDEDEYNEMLEIIEKGIKEMEVEQKKEDEKEEKEEEKEELDGEALFKKWGLVKLWDAMNDAGCTDVEDWKYVEDEDLTEMG